jgi:4-oxalomesaconate tautomerase
VAADIAQLNPAGESQRVEVEHPTGFFTVEMQVETEGAEIKVRRSALLRTARKLMSGEVFVPAQVWQR